MITSKDFPDITFATKEALFKALRENADKIIAIKRATVYKSIDKGDANSGFLTKFNDSEKAMPMKDGFIYPIINTTKYMDGHSDVHFDGIWTKSIKEQAGKLFYVLDHETKIKSVIAWPEDVNAMVKTVPWGFVGKDYEGNTEALVYEISKEKLVNADAKKIIEEKRPVQNSVRMMYVKVQLGINSTAKEDVEYKKYFDSRIELIANKSAVIEQGYFWGVEEAKIVTEGSMVLRGSNDATPIKETNEDQDAGKSTSVNEPSNDTRLKEFYESLYNKLKN